MTEREALPRAAGAVAGWVLRFLGLLGLPVTLAIMVAGRRLRGLHHAAAQRRARRHGAIFGAWNLAIVAVAAVDPSGPLLPIGPEPLALLLLLLLLMLAELLIGLSAVGAAILTAGLRDRH